MCFKKIQDKQLTFLIPSNEKRRLKVSTAENLPKIFFHIVEKQLMFVIVAECMICPTSNQRMASSTPARGKQNMKYGEIEH